jgi:hypothetical protein
MVKTIKNFARFFALFNRMQKADEELKMELVGTFTGGRTTSLREMEAAEYNRMCDAMQASLDGDGKTTEEYQKQMREARSAVLKRLQRLGVDTTDFASVDKYCLDSRIAGKEFRKLSKEELEALVRKLSAIERKKASTVRQGLSSTGSATDRTGSVRVLKLGNGYTVQAIELGKMGFVILN